MAVTEQGRRRTLTKSELPIYLASLSQPERRAEIILWRHKVRKASQSWPSKRMEERSVAQDENYE